MDEFPIGVQLLLWSMILFWLRATIDRQKGALIEIFAVTLPIAIVAFIAWAMRLNQSMKELGVILTPFVVFIFLSLPLIVATRFAERLFRGEQPQLADIFRLTTIAGLSIFVVRQLEVDPRGLMFVSVLTGAYLAGDCVSRSSPPLRRITWFVVAAVSLIVISVIMANTLDMGYNGSFSELIRSSNLLFLLSAAAVFNALFDRFGHFVRLGYWSEVIRSRNAQARDAIYHRTLFRLWRIRGDVCYLNHGSFGAVPLRVQKVHHAWQRRCEAEPMDVLLRQTENAWRASRDQLAFWLGSTPDRLALCENATVAMNEIASWFPLKAGDQVLLTDHEYGPVKRIWQRRAAQLGAEATIVKLPMPFDDADRIVQSILAACTSRTRLVVISHITSPTATILPVAALCKALREREIASCVDGPHAILQERVHLSRLECDFYTGSCNKWLCAPLGSGFVYVHPRWEASIQPMRLSWGLLPPAQPSSWTDELTWIGTRDYSPYMTLPAAIAFFSKFDYEWLDTRNHELALYARRVISEMLGTEPVMPGERQWMGWMAAIWLPPGDHSQLQKRLWERWKIEVLIVHFDDRYLVRVSCHLYNSTHDVDHLARALAVELRQVGLG